MPQCLGKKGHDPYQMAVKDVELFAGNGCTKMLLQVGKHLCNRCHSLRKAFEEMHKV